MGSNVGKYEGSGVRSSVGSYVGSGVGSHLYSVGDRVASATGLVKLGCFSVGDSLGA